MRDEFNTETETKLVTLKHDVLEKARSDANHDSLRDIKFYIQQLREEINAKFKRDDKASLYEKKFHALEIADLQTNKTIKENFIITQKIIREIGEIDERIEDIERDLHEVQEHQYAEKKEQEVSVIEKRLEKRIKKIKDKGHAKQRSESALGPQSTQMPELTTKRPFKFSEEQNLEFRKFSRSRRNVRANAYQSTI